MSQLTAEKYEMLENIVGELTALLAEESVTGVLIEVHRGPLSKSIREWGNCSCPTYQEGDVRIEVTEQYDQTALELCDVCGWKAIIPDEGCLVCARKNQEPVAWGEFKGDKLHDLFCTKYDADNIKKFRKDESVVKPLYTAPPKREWVGLEDERDYIWDVIGNSDAHGDVDGGSGERVMDAIEAKLKEKNNV